MGDPGFFLDSRVVLQSMVGAFAGGIAAYVAIRVELAVMKVRIDMHADSLKRLQDRAEKIENTREFHRR